MCCETRSHHGGSCDCGCHSDYHGGSRDCGCGGRSFGRRFVTREEKIAGLREYLESLQKEAQAVQEHIARLQEEE